MDPAPLIPSPLDPMILPPPIDFGDKGDVFRRKKRKSVAMRCKQTKVVLEVSGPPKQITPVKPVKTEYGFGLEPEGNHGFNIVAFVAEGVNHVLGWITWALGIN